MELNQKPCNPFQDNYWFSTAIYIRERTATARGWKNRLFLQICKFCTDVFLTTGKFKFVIKWISTDWLSNSIDNAITNNWKILRTIQHTVWIEKTCCRSYWDLIDCQSVAKSMSCNLANLEFILSELSWYISNTNITLILVMLLIEEVIVQIRGSTSSDFQKPRGVEITLPSRVFLN